MFERGNRLDYEVILGVINYFKDHPDSCHHPKEDLILEKLQRARTYGSVRGALSNERPYRDRVYFAAVHESGFGVLGCRGMMSAITEKSGG